jgi:hypothetical protein
MKLFARLILILALAANLFAQQAKDAADSPSKDQPQKRESPDPAPTFNFFKLSFAMYEMDDGKRSNQRDYMMIARSDNQPSSIRISTRVPVYNGQQMTYVDAGLTLRCFAKEQIDRRLQLQCDVEVSSFFRPDPQAGTSTGASAPLLRSTHTSSWALLTLGKPAILATVDDVNSPKRMQIEVTATKVD